MIKHVYISADYSQDNGDRIVCNYDNELFIDQLID